jgi:hypothetical protein
MWRRMVKSVLVVLGVLPGLALAVALILGVMYVSSKNEIVTKNEAIKSAIL